MRPTLKRLEVKDIGALERLVAENVEGIEPGLKVIDSRLLLGQAAIDLVGLDAKGSLVLIALDFTADEGLLLRGMDAYSWCLEYPDTIGRLYPAAEISPARPPRILFIVERLTDAFVRRIKQLRFLEIDCLEFRHLEVNGASALYFDLVQRLRRASAESGASLDVESRVLHASPARQTPVSRPASRIVAAPSVVPTRTAEPVAPAPAPPLEPVRAVTAVALPDEPVQAIEPVVAQALAPEATPEAPAVSESIADPEPAPVPVSALDARTAALLAEAAASAVGESSVEPEASPVEAAAPVEVTVSAVEPEPTVNVVEPEIRREADQEVAGRPEPAAPTNLEWQALLKGLGVDMPSVPTPAEPEPTPTAHEEAEASMFTRPQETTAPAPVQPPAWAKPPVQPVQPIVTPGAGRTYFFAQAVKGTPAADAPSAPAPTPAAPSQAPVTPAAPVAPADPVTPKMELAGTEETPEAPAGLEALNLPKDGLSRQWLEFLSQLSATK
jgi:hypothetical protein